VMLARFVRCFPIAYSAFAFSSSDCTGSPERKGCCARDPCACPFHPCSAMCTAKGTQRSMTTPMATIRNRAQRHEQCQASDPAQASSNAYEGQGGRVLCEPPRRQEGLGGGYFYVECTFDAAATR